jgi:hypothetical protein
MTMPRRPRAAPAIVTTQHRKAVADLPTVGQSYIAKNAIPGEDKVTGRPLSVYPTLPAGGMAFAVNRYRSAPADWEYGDGLLEFDAVSAPTGWVMIVTGWKISVRQPLNSAVIGQTYLVAPVTGRLVKNGQPDLGTVSGLPAFDGTAFWLFDKKKPVHIVLWGDDRLEAQFYIQTDPDQAVQDLMLELEGYYLQPNMMAPEYTEQEIGEVRVHG